MIVFCRHGQTTFNLQDKFQGISDSALTEKGVEQARRLNEFLKEKFGSMPVSLFHSPLKRVRDTTRHAVKDLNCHVEELQDLLEVCYGDWEEKYKKHIEPSLLAMREQTRFTFVHPGSYNGRSGESYAHYYARLLPHFRKWEAELKEKNIVVVGHLGTLTTAWKYFRKLSDSEVGRVRMLNNEVILVKKIGKSIGAKRYIL